MLKRVAKSKLNTVYGVFDEYLYMDGDHEAIALVVGSVKNGSCILCRIHSHCISGHVFHGIECDCEQQMIFSQEIIQKNRRGVIIWLDQEGRGNGHLAKLRSNPYKEAGLTQSEAYVRAGYPADSREYSYAKYILDDLGIRSIELISDSQEKLNRIKEIGIKVCGVRHTK